MARQGEKTRSLPVHVGGVLGHLEGDLHVGHGSQVVNFVGADLGDELRREEGKGRDDSDEVCRREYAREENKMLVPESDSSSP